jgi:glycine/D-amino acid oxidase-like deaminating enzyme
MKWLPYWLDTAPASADYSGRELPAAVDVAVIGGGFTGLSAGIHLAKKGASVAILEKDRFGWGASGRNGGMCTTGATVGFLTLIKRYGIDTAKRLYLVYDEAINCVERLATQEGFECHFARSGKLSLAAKPEHFAGFEKTHDALAAHLGHETMLVRASELNGEIGSSFYHGGLVEPTSAGLHVGKFARGLVSLADRLGASLHEDAAVVGLQKADGGYAVQTKTSVVRASQVLVATNGYTDGAVPYFRRRIVPVGSFIVVTEPLGESAVQTLMPTRRMASDTRNLIYYFRVTPDNRMLFGGRAQYTLPSPGADRRSAQILQQGMVSVFPSLRDAKVEYAWGGQVGFTFDRIPHAGEHDGMYYSMGYCGHGVQMSTYMGQQMAEVMNGHPEANPWRDFRFKAVPLHFGNPWFLPLADAYYRVKDKIR